MTINDYFKDWMKVIDVNTLKSIMQQLIKEYNKCECTPPIKDVFKAFVLCKYDDLRIVFLGQDPYPQRGIATSLAFGNKRDTVNMSPSLNILKEAVINPKVPHGIIQFDNTLESWAEQGILLLNSALTTECNHIGSHILLWRPFVIQLLQRLSSINTGIIYVLFGEQAISYERYINNKFNYVLKVKHPAYYARTNTEMDSKLFDDINSILYKNNGFKIKWYEDLDG